jgi:hypothetical protein
VNGDKYVGEFKNGKKCGQGTIIYNDGSKFVGEFKEGESFFETLIKSTTI